MLEMRKVLGSLVLFSRTVFITGKEKIKLDSRFYFAPIVIRLVGYRVRMNLT
jgi:hypothetical protein